MATVEEMREEIKFDIDDDSFNDELIDRLINRGLKHTSSKVLLKSLETSGSSNSEVGSPYIAKPSGFGHNIFKASTARGPVEIFSSMALMLEEYPMLDMDNEEGDIKFCCIHGDRIAIHPVPTVITSVKLFFHGWPPVLEETDDLDDYIDGEDHQYETVYNYVMWKLNRKLEDGVEGAMNNSLNFEDRFEAGVKALDLATTQGQSRPQPVRKTWGV